MEFAPELMIPDPSLSIDDGAIAVLGWQSVTNEGSFTRDDGSIGKKIQF